MSFFALRCTSAVVFKLNHLTVFKRSHLTVLLNPGPAPRYVTGGVAEINFGGHEKFIYVNSTGAREVYSSVDQTKKVKTKKNFFSSVQIFSQTLIVVSKFLQFSTNS